MLTTQMGGGSIITQRMCKGYMVVVCVCPQGVFLSVTVLAATHCVYKSQMGCTYMYVLCGFRFNHMQHPCSLGFMLRPHPPELYYTYIHTGVMLTLTVL